MPVNNEKQFLGDLLKHEYEQPNYTRSVETVLADATNDQTHLLGTVVGKITASGKVTPIKHGASDGSQTAYGVILYDVAVPKTVDTKAVVIVRGPAIVDTNKLIWEDATITGGDQTAALATLKGLGILGIAGSTVTGPV